MSPTNKWDALSQHFDTSKNEEDLPGGIAENILIAWPVVLRVLKKFVSPKKHAHVLEYGCGGGGFAHKLHTLGYDVAGIDTSERMIEVAKKSYGQIAFYAGDLTTAKQFAPFDAITAIMVLQFIENIESAFASFSNLLSPNGIFAFAVFNPDNVIARLQANTFFQNFDSETHPTKGEVRFDSGITIPVYIRTAKQYDAIAQKNNFLPIHKEIPPFTKTFLEKYPMNKQVQVPKFLILAYQKQQ